jgi:hypothetical protein
MYFNDLDNVQDINAQTGSVGTLGVTTATIGTLNVNTALNVGGDIDMNNNKITEVGTPTISSDAATKGYVDDNSGVSDHGALTGLSDDDHPQYFKADGTRGMSGYINMNNNPIINCSSLDMDGIIDMNLHNIVDCGNFSAAGTGSFGGDVDMNGNGINELSNIYGQNTGILTDDTIHFFTYTGSAYDYTMGMNKNGVEVYDDLYLVSGSKLYLYKGSTDAASMYITRDNTSGNMIFHLPSGKSVEWQVG